MDRAAPHLSGGGDLLLPVLLHVQLGAAAHAAHAGHAGHGLSDVASLLPGRKDLRGGGRNLQNITVTVRTFTTEVQVS